MACDNWPVTLPHMKLGPSCHSTPAGEDKPIACISRTDIPADWERNVGYYLQDQKFHTYLFGWKFTLLTEHHPLTSISLPHSGITPLAASRMQLWVLILSAHSDDIKQWKGWSSRQCCQLVMASPTGQVSECLWVAQPDLGLEPNRTTLESPENSCAAKLPIQPDRDWERTNSSNAGVSRLYYNIFIFLAM